MKTSNKILVALVILTLISLLAFNLLMKSKYKRGEFSEEPKLQKIN